MVSGKTSDVFVQEMRSQKKGKLWLRSENPVFVGISCSETECDVNSTWMPSVEAGTTWNLAT